MRWRSRVSVGLLGSIQLDFRDGCSLQYGEKSFALEVEAGADVADDLGVRVSFSHESDLPLEVRRLLLGRDAAVADCDGGL